MLDYKGMTSELSAEAVVRLYILSTARTTLEIRLSHRMNWVFQAQKPGMGHLSVFRTQGLVHG